MSWHYLQEQAAAFWEGDLLDGAPDALLKLIPTAGKSSSLDSEMGTSTHSPSGMMSPRSTAPGGEGTSTLYRVVSPAKTSALREKAQASQARSPGSGDSLLGSLAKFDPDSSSWKTAQPSLLEGSRPCSLTWSRWGSIANGVYWARTMPEHLTSGTVFGFLQEGQASAWVVPTPSASRYGTNRGGGMGRTGKVRPSLDTMAKRNLWPTPVAGDSRGAGPNQHTKTLGRAIKRQEGGHLNPDWVELLMGWPRGWTSLEGGVGEVKRTGWWGEGWEDGIPRVSKCVPSRPARLRAIGNGQVPAVVELAFNTLLKRLEMGHG